MKGYSDDIYDSLEPSDRNLLILVDQLSEASNTQSLANIFPKWSHHRNVTILYLVQNMFDQGKSSLTVSLNSHYTVGFRNLRDQSQFRTMARQILPINSDWLIDAYADATVRPFGYLVINNSPYCDPIFRFRTNKFRGELPTVYCDKKAVYKSPRSSSTNKIFSNLMSKSKSNKVRKELKKVKHIIKFLSHSPANKITKAILGDSPDGVIRAIANAALNLQQNPGVKLDSATRNLFSTYSQSFSILTDRKISIENKRKHLTQKGGALPFLGPLLGSALLSICSGFISRIFNRGENNE